jgi:hypothetical protein
MAFDVRAFIVGNGASLKSTPLELLRDEITFGVTNVHKIYPLTNWRPTYYVRAEEASGLEPKNWLESMRVHLELGCEIYCNDFFFRPRFGLRATDKVHFIKACAHYGKHFDNMDTPHLWHLPRLCTFGSSVNVAVQLAHELGYSPIYLVGCDLDKNMNHFTEEYRHGREQENRYAQMDTLAAHMIAARMGLEIYNATVGGELEAYPRVEFESLFQCVVSS